MPISGATLRAVQEPRRIHTTWIHPRGLGWDQRWTEGTERYFQRSSRIGEHGTLLAFSPQHKLGIVLVGRDLRSLESLATELLAAAIPGLSEVHRALAAREEGRFEDARAEYLRLTSRYPEDGLGYHGLGTLAIFEPGTPWAALEPLQLAYDYGYLRANSAYNLACAYSRLERVELALDWLAKARAGGFQDEVHLDEDPDLELLRDHPRFAELARPAY